MNGYIASALAHTLGAHDLAHGLFAYGVAESLYSYFNVRDGSDGVGAGMRWAVESGNVKAVKTLLAFPDAAKHHVDEHGDDHCLRWARKSGNTTLVNMLLAMDGRSTECEPYPFMPQLKERLSTAST